MKSSTRKKLKLTPWYEVWQKPLKSRPGKYRTRYWVGGSVLVLYWSGSEWKDADKEYVLWAQDFMWQGVSR